MTKKETVAKNIVSKSKDYPIRRYDDNLPDEIINLSKAAAHGLMNCQLAVKLSIAESTLYDWASKYPAFKYALEMCAAYRKDCLIEQYNANYLTEDRDTKFYDRANIDYLRIAGMGAGFKCIKGVDDEHKAMQKIQDAVASGELNQDAAITMTKILESKANIRKSLTMEADIESIKKQLGMS